MRGSVYMKRKKPTETKNKSAVACDWGWGED